MYGFIRSTVKGFDFHMLFQPLEKQFNLPSGTIDFTNLFCIQIEAIGYNSNRVSF